MQYPHFNCFVSHCQLGSIDLCSWKISSKSTTYAGLDPQCLPRRAWCQHIRRGEHAIASVCGGFYRRQTIQALGGWMLSGHREGAEAEMALAMQALSMRAIAEPESRITAPRNVIEGQLGGYALGNYAGKLAMAYSQLTSSSRASAGSPAASRSPSVRSIAPSAGRARGGTRQGARARSRAFVRCA